MGDKVPPVLYEKERSFMTTKATRVRRKRKSFEMDSLELCVSILNQVLRDETTPRSLIQSQIDRIGRRIEFLQNPQGGLFREIERLRLEGKSWESISGLLNESRDTSLRPRRGSSWTGCNVRMWYTRYLDKHKEDL
jgi:hypothetical protein